MYEDDQTGRISRKAREREAVERHLPPTTRSLTVDGVDGWLYEITSPLGDEFVMFVYHNGCYYETMIVSPEIEDEHIHACHVYTNRAVDLGHPQELQALERAYAKSVVWANGFSVLLRTGAWPNLSASAV